MQYYRNSFIFYSTEMATKLKAASSCDLDAGVYFDGRKQTCSGKRRETEEATGQG